MAKQQAQLDAFAKEEADENATKIKQHEEALIALRADITNGESAIKRAKEEEGALVNALRILKGQTKFKHYTRVEKSFQDDLFKEYFDKKSGHFKISLEEMTTKFMAGFPGREPHLVNRYLGKQRTDFKMKKGRFGPKTPKKKSPKKKSPKKKGKKATKPNTRSAGELYNKELKRRRSNDFILPRIDKKIFYWRS